MKNKVHVTIALGLDTDIEKVWDQIKQYGPRLTGRNSKYVIEFEGDAIEAMRIIEVVEREKDHKVIAHYESSAPFGPN